MRVENENQWGPLNGASWPIKGLNIKCNNSLQFGYFRHDHIRKSCIIWVYYGLWTLSGENKVTNTSFSCCASLSTSIHPDTRVLWIIHHLGPSLTSGSRLWMSPEDEWTVLLLSLIGCWHEGSGGCQGSEGWSFSLVIIDFLWRAVSLP